jgi:hypothetical protein
VNEFPPVYGPLCPDGKDQEITAPSRVGQENWSPHLLTGFADVRLAEMFGIFMTQWKTDHGFAALHETKPTTVKSNMGEDRFIVETRQVKQDR